MKTFNQFLSENVSFNQIVNDALMLEKLDANDFDISAEDYQKIDQWLQSKMRIAQQKKANRKQAIDAVKNVFVDMGKKFPDVANAFLMRFMMKKRSN